MKAIILAAGRGIRLKSLSNKIPKCMIPISGKPILERQVDLLKKSKINDITVVTGSLSSKIKISNISFIKNKFYRSTEQNYSIFCARNKLNGSVMISFADIIYDKKILGELINFKGDCGIAVRKNWKKSYENRSLHPISEADNVLVKEKKIIKIKKNIVTHNKDEKIVEFLGLIKFSGRGASLFLKKLQYLNKYHKGKFHTANSFKKAYLIDMIQELINSGIRVTPIFVDGKYFEIDTPEDVKNVEKSIKKF
jgi:choline kinase|tara:strand:- start:1704 stop:2459 length:756 start_codon:yes stop_codon:yes gene_type:complete